MDMKNSALVLLVLLSAIMVTSSAAIAAPVWTCSIVRATGVDEDGTVGTPDLGDIEPPTFLRVDPERKEVTLLAPPSRKGEVTKIDSAHQGEGIWVFSGVEEGRAWSMVISDAGYMTLSITGDGATWSVFGNALREN